MTSRYRPSNGTEGEIFMNHFCDRCSKDAKYRETLDGSDGCEILANTLVFEIDDPEYPKEWIRDEKGPRCTAFEEEKT